MWPEFSLPRIFMARLCSSHIMMQCNKNAGYRSSCLWKIKKEEEWAFSEKFHSKIIFWIYVEIVWRMKYGQIWFSCEFHHISYGNWCTHLFICNLRIAGQIPFKRWHRAKRLIQCRHKHHGTINRYCVSINWIAKRCDT